MSLGYSIPGHGEYRYGPFSLSAFGTLALNWLSDDNADFAPNNRPNGPGYSKDLDLGLDSRFGAQANLSLGGSTLITAQAVTEHTPSNDYSPRLTLGNIRHEFLDHFAVRIGRIQSPVFLASEYRLANFPNPWVRPPVVVYSVYPLVHQDGADLTYFFDTGFGKLSFQSGYGWLNYQTPAGLNLPPDSVDLNNIVFMNTQLENGDWQFRFSVLNFDLSYPNTSLDQGLAAIGATDPIAADKLRIHRKNTFVYAAGLSYDGPDWLLMAEWTLRTSQSALIGRQGAYLTVGYHFDRFMPQVTLGYQGTAESAVDSDDPGAQAIITGINNSQRSDHFTAGIGFNYGLFDFAVLRGQLDIIQPDDRSYGPFRNIQPDYNFANPERYYLVTFSVDVVF